jgi:hypothetical protein
MATEPGYTVLPVSELKRHLTAIFDALEADKTVYIAKRGKIVAAFQPYTAVPESVTAIHGSPILKDLPSITARQIGRESLSEAIIEAESGLPRVVEREGRIYGMLTSAHAPALKTIPNPETVGAKAEALLDYQKSNPDASIDDIMAYSDGLDQAHDNTPSQQAWPLAAELETQDAIDADIAGWRARESQVEDIVVMIFTFFEKALSPVDIEAAPFVNPLALQAFINQSNDLSEIVRFTSNPATRWNIIQGERLEAAGQLVDARAMYVRTLMTPTTMLPDPGVMWRLGNLDRRIGYRAEAARWFRLALSVDVLAGAVDSISPEGGYRAEARPDSELRRPLRARGR